MAFHIAKSPELFFHTVKDKLDHSLESYIWNLYGQYAFGDYIALAVIGLMWKLKITVLVPDKEEIHVFHRSNNPDVVLVYDNMSGADGHFTTTGG